MGQMKGLGLSPHSLDTTYDFIAKAASKVELNQIFSDIEKSDEDGVKDLSAFPYTKQDKSQVKKQLLAINRKGNMADPKTNLMNLRSKKVDIEERRLRLEFEIEERKIILRKR
ncbi:12243_t:CDS:2 [Rhizophagus irregularis]|nr:12243_t:CDS:2 [Rhizophagus irregularis]